MLFSFFLGVVVNVFVIFKCSLFIKKSFYVNGIDFVFFDYKGLKNDRYKCMEMKFFLYKEIMYYVVYFIFLLW